MRSLPLVLLCGVALVACEPTPKTDKTIAPSNPPPAPAPATPEPFAGDINLMGTEPFWAVEVREATLKLSRPGEADFIAPNPQAVVTPDKATWTSNGLTVTLTATPCSDGMSDRIYPWTAQAIYGGATLSGCAIKAQDLTDAPKP